MYINKQLVLLITLFFAATSFAADDRPKSPLFHSHFPQWYTDAIAESINFLTKLFTDPHQILQNHSLFRDRRSRRQIEHTDEQPAGGSRKNYDDQGLRQRTPSQRQPRGGGHDPCLTNAASDFESCDKYFSQEEDDFYLYGGDKGKGKEEEKKESSSSSSSGSGSSHHSKHVRSQDGSYFYDQSEQLKQRLKILHPIMHGLAEVEQASLFEQTKNSACAAGEALANFDVVGAFNELKKNKELSDATRLAVAALVAGKCGSAGESLMKHIGFYNAFDSEEGAPGGLSFDALDAAEDKVMEMFPNWDEQRDCPEGICHCKKLGNTSKATLVAIHRFFENINAYENRIGHSYFKERDTDKVMTFLSRVSTRIGEESILRAIAKNGTTPDDRELKPYLKVVNYLLALPTQLHDPEPDWQRNKIDIDNKLQFLPQTQQDEMYEYLRILLRNGQDRHYGHQDGDSSINLIVAGGSGSGKSFLVEKLPPLLGWQLIRTSFEDMSSVYGDGCSDLEDALDAEPKGIQKKWLQLDQQKKGPLVPLNPLILLEEVGKDRVNPTSSLTPSQIKEQFDQFRRMSLPFLGNIEIPGFSNFICITNDTSFLRKDPAHVSRFKHIVLPPKTRDMKLVILRKHLLEKIAQDQTLQEKYAENQSLFDQLIERMVDHNKKINIRILLDNKWTVIESILLSEQVKQGKDFLVPPNRRQEGALEKFDETLERNFRGLALGSDDEE